MDSLSRENKETLKMWERGGRIKRNTEDDLRNLLARRLERNTSRGLTRKRN
jgi:hypothetical protein